MPLNLLLKALPFHPKQSSLATILLGDTGLSSANFPIISEASFQVFLREVPHLFAQGQLLLEWLHESAQVIKVQPSNTLESTDSIERAMSVLRTIIQTAAITAPTDLWLLHLVLSSWSRVGLTERLQRGEALHLPSVAKQGGLDLVQLNLDAHLLRSRGIIRKGVDAAYQLVESVEARSIMQQLPVLPTAWPVDWLAHLTSYFTGKDLVQAEHTLLTEFFAVPQGLVPSTNWRPSALEIILGHRLVPLVLAYHNSPLAKESLEAGDVFLCPQGSLTQNLQTLLTLAGVLTRDGKLTLLGARIFARGPGPFGIIHAYHTYLNSHTQLLKGQTQDSWVARGQNIAASQDANQRTFTMINDALDLFIKETRFPLKIFIEHAVGQGEAIRQRYARSGDTSIQYFGADLEDAAISQAKTLQAQGHLPKNTRFIASADIGDPAYLLQELARLGVSAQGAVMVVGNGFHEVRRQTDDKMIKIFKAYHDAGILLIFAEESALSDQDLLNTAWNTYHAGFRFVHDISGQGLRPAYDYDQEMNRYSWKLCAEKAGYFVHPRYSTHTRKIYPFPREDGYNPAISVNYFCIPSM